MNSLALALFVLFLVLPLITLTFLAFSQYRNFRALQRGFNYSLTELFAGCLGLSPVMAWVALVINGSRTTAPIALILVILLFLTVLAAMFNAKLHYELTRGEKITAPTKAASYILAGAVVGNLTLLAILFLFSMLRSRG